MLTLKDYKMHCIGYRGYDDEWYSNSDYQSFLKIDNHHYYINIWKRRKNNWGLRVYLCLTSTKSKDILITEQSATTMKSLKQLAVDEINKYHNSNKCKLDIENWKKEHGKKVFDSEYKYLGITYTNPEREKNDKEFDYYNDNKPSITYGTYYMLDKESVMVCKIGIGWSSIQYRRDEELKKKIISNKEI